MERFAPQTLEAFRPRLVLVEKSILADPAGARAFRVAGTPTFVLLDAAGKELTRFFCEPTPEGLTARVAPALPAPG
jgi:hypothetical protein